MEIACERVEVKGGRSIEERKERSRKITGDHRAKTWVSKDKRTQRELQHAHSFDLGPFGDDLWLGRKKMLTCSARCVPHSAHT